MRRPALLAYVAAVSLLALVGVTLLPDLIRTPPAWTSPSFWLLAAYVVGGEVFPLRVLRSGRQGLLTVSTTFAFALLLWLGVAEALVALVGGSIANDIVRRERWLKSLFNAAQLTLSVVVAGAVLDALRPDVLPPVPIADTGLVATGAAALAFFLVNFLLSGVALALASNIDPTTLLRRDVGPQAVWSAVLLSLAPIVVAAAQTSPVLLPLFAFPIAMVYRSMDVFLRRAHEALHDPLTGLPNRALFKDRVEQAILATERSHRQAAILVLDLDGFKDVNDTLGHAAGDEVLQSIAARLTGVLRDVDTVARLGGDEFGIVLSQVSGEGDAVEVARKLRTAVHEPLTFGGLVMNLEGSIGAALSPVHGTDPDALVTYADAAMYQAKRLQSGWEVHEPLRFEEAEDRMTRLSKLRQALRRGQLELHYQPKYAVDTGRIEGLEALVRWNDPVEGLVPPDRFIPLAEESGLIREVSRFVLGTAIAEIRALAEEGLRQRIAVNVSARDLQDPTLPEEVAALLRGSGVDPRWLELEITERTIMSNPDQAVAVVTRLHDLGVTITIDDFGTGNTSLALLSQLPIDCLKIDRSLVASMSEVRADAVIVETTIDLGHNLGMTVVAEGVESESVWQRLFELGCDSAQGYYCARPMPAAALREQLQRSS